MLYWKPKRSLKKCNTEIFYYSEKKQSYYRLRSEKLFCVNFIITSQKIYMWRSQQVKQITW